MRALAALLVLAAPAFGQQLTATDGRTRLVIDQPVDRYGHAIMGDVPEWSRLCLARDGREDCVTLPETAIFEEMEARLADIDGDGQAEAVVVESDARLGAALVVYDLDKDGLTRTASPNIGARYRWLAPIGVADLDGDGAMEVAWVDRPHLAKILRVWRWADGTLREVATLPDVTNHAIGEPFIASAIRSCDGLPELILTDARRAAILGVRLVGNGLQTRVIGPYSGPASIRAAARC